jgi:predicted XRE-type DNA-binding protein
MSPSQALPKEASLQDQVKYSLCEQFVIYLQVKQLTQRQLAEKLGTTEARVSEIVHYHLNKVTIDRLIHYLAIIKPNTKIKVA